ncbi:Uncharacterised protein [Candidatus Anstonella stagnisolia]|nr:Uncharacterised protein [Candidatus Anstonella stagnisolia]
MTQVILFAPTSTQINFQENVFSEQVALDHAKRDIAQLLQQAQARLPEVNTPHRMIGTVKIETDAAHLGKILDVYRGVVAEENLRLKEQGIPIHMEITNGGHGEIYLAIANYEPIEKPHMEFPLTFDLSRVKQADYAALIQGSDYAQEDKEQLLKIIPEIYALAEKGKVNLAAVTIGRAEEGSLVIEGVNRPKSRVRIAQAESSSPPVEQTVFDAKSKSQQIAIILSPKDRDKLIVPEAELNAMGPYELTDAQWKILSSYFDAVSENSYGVGFGVLEQSQRIDIVRKLISPHENAGKALGFRYEGADDVKSAARTLSGMVGDCDDYSLLYIACINRLQNEGKLDKRGFDLAVAQYYDPTEPKICGHANVIQFGRRDERAVTGRETTFIVDFTVKTSTADMDLNPELAQAPNDSLRNKFIQYMNTGRKKSEMIKPEFVSFKHFDSFEGVQVYYSRQEGARLLKEGQNQEAIEILAVGIGIAERVGLPHEDLSFYMAKARRNEGTRLIREGADLYEKGNEADGQAKIDAGVPLLKAADNDYAAILQLNGLSPLVLNEAAYECRVNKDYATAQTLAIRAIEGAPFIDDYYTELWKILDEQGKYSEAQKIFQGYRDMLDKLDKSKSGSIAELKNKLDGFVNAAHDKTGENH